VPPKKKTKERPTRTAQCRPVEKLVKALDDHAEKDDRSRSAYLKRLITEGAVRKEIGKKEPPVTFATAKAKESEIQVFTRLGQELILRLNTLTKKEQRPRSIFLKRLIIQGLNLEIG